MAVWPQKIILFFKGVSKNKNIHKNLIVVYFDQRAHACTCVRTVRNNEKHSKMMKRVFQRTFTSFTCVAHVEKSNNNPRLEIEVDASSIAVLEYWAMFDYYNRH